MKINKNFGPVFYAGPVLFLLFLVALPGTSLCAAPAADFSQGPDTAPVLGNVRIPVIFIRPQEAGNNEQTPLVNRDFFRNDLDAHTFRNFWRTNSLGAYDPKCFLANLKSSPDIAAPDSFPENAPESVRWRGYAVSVVKKLYDNEILPPALFDSAGPGFIPDGWMDGVIIITPEATTIGAYPADNNEDSFDNISVGPVLIVPYGASAADILSGFSHILGMNSSLKGCPECLSICSDNNRGFPIPDAFSRLAAGWANVIDLNGPMRDVLFLPAQTTGNIYRIGSDKDFFLVENRAAESGYDLDLKEPGLAVFHVFLEDGSSGPPQVRVVSPSKKNAAAEKCSPSDSLFRNRDMLGPDYMNQNPPKNTGAASSNFHDGTPSDIVIMDIETEKHFPVIRAAAGYW